LPVDNNNDDDDDDDDKDNNDGNAEQNNDKLQKWIKRQRTDYWNYLTDPNSVRHSMTNEKVVKLREAKFAWIDEDEALYEANLLTKQISPNTSITTSDGGGTIMRRSQTRVDYHEIYTTAESLSKHPRLNAAIESAYTVMEPHLSPLSSFVAGGRQTPINVMGAIQHLAPSDQTIVQNYIASLKSTIMGVESDCHSLRQRCMQMQLQLSCLDSNGLTHSTFAAAASTTATIPTQSDEYNEADDTVQSAIAAAAAAAEQNQQVITESLLASGYKLNASGAPYRNGAAKSLADKAAIASIYLQMKLADPAVSQRAVAKAARVSCKYVKKIIDEVKSGQLVDDTTKPRKRKRGAGVKSITPEDAKVLLEIQKEVGDYRGGHEKMSDEQETDNDDDGTSTTTKKKKKKKKKAVVQKKRHHRWNVPISLGGYSDRLFETTGHRVSKSVICKWFQSQAAGGGGGIGRMSKTTGDEGDDEDAAAVDEEDDGVAAAVFENEIDDQYL
jgi:hypothetical protein